MGPFKVSGTALFQIGNNHVFFLQDMVSPQVECWFMLNALNYGIFGNLDLAPLLKVG